MDIENERNKLLLEKIPTKALVDGIQSFLKELHITAVGCTPVFDLLISCLEQPLIDYGEDEYEKGFQDGLNEAYSFLDEGLPDEILEGEDFDDEDEETLGLNEEEEEEEEEEEDLYDE